MAASMWVHTTWELCDLMCVRVSVIKMNEKVEYKMGE